MGFPPDKNECELINFMIDVPFQKNKLGSLLMDYFLQMLKNTGVKIVKLNVFENNFIALNFYKRYGFNVEWRNYSECWNIYVLRLYKNT
jgi:ribosomal protein S18 acetylase RimI-like enzyme